MTTTPNPAAGGSRPRPHLLSLATGALCAGRRIPSRVAFTTRFFFVLPSRALRFAAGVALALCLLPPALHAAPLNDTGIQFCGEYPSGNTNPPCTPNPEGQDARFGADAAAQAGVRYKVGAGSAGFDFTKIANNGSELDASAALGSGATDWACTRDNTTGLVWEVKVDDAAHLRHLGHSYTWYFDPSPDGYVGTLGNHTTCSGLTNCNTSAFANAVNTAQLCGFNDWRVPTVGELKNLVDHGRINPTIDPTFFPNSPASDFWSASPGAGFAGYAWLVNFSDGVAGFLNRNYNFRVRLVRGGQ